MKVRFWGTRGSLPASLTATQIRRKVVSALRIARDRGLGDESDVEAFVEEKLPFWIKGTYGTNTSCIEIREGEQFILCDAGSGIRDFARHLRLQQGQRSAQEFHIFLSHLHWDHLQGFPFFSPAYDSSCRITFYGCHEGMEKAFSMQHGQPFFPVNYEELPALLRFVRLTPGESYEIAGFRVLAQEQCHPGRSYGYRFEKSEKVVVYSTDSEHHCEAEEVQTVPFTRFFSNADLLIFDAQYSFQDACTVKEDWGHSSNLTGVELAVRGRVKHLCLFHQDPVSSDEDLDAFLVETMNLASQYQPQVPLRISVAWDGMVLEI